MGCELELEVVVELWLLEAVEMDDVEEVMLEVVVDADEVELEDAVEVELVEAEVVVKVVEEAADVAVDPDWVDDDEVLGEEEVVVMMDWVELVVEWRAKEAPTKAAATTRISTPAAAATSLPFISSRLLRAVLFEDRDLVPLRAEDARRVDSEPVLEDGGVDLPVVDVEEEVAGGVEVGEVGVGSVEAGADLTRPL